MAGRAMIPAQSPLDLRRAARHLSAVPAAAGVGCLLHLHRMTPFSSTVATCLSLARPVVVLSNGRSFGRKGRYQEDATYLDGCDFEHWLVVTDPPDSDLSRDEIIDGYVKILAQVVGSEEEAKTKIYSVSTKHYFAFGCYGSEELSHKLRDVPKVQWVLPDSYLDVKNKDYGGEPFKDGEPAPYDPKYHDKWLRSNTIHKERRRHNGRPLRFDRSRSFERQREDAYDMPRQQTRRTGIDSRTF